MPSNKFLSISGLPMQREQCPQRYGFPFPVGVLSSLDTEQSPWFRPGRIEFYKFSAVATLGERHMRFYIDVITENGVIKDPTGSDFVSLQAAREEAVQSARDLMADALASGKDAQLDWEIRISLADGTELISLSFEDCGYRRSNVRHLYHWEKHSRAFLRRHAATQVTIRNITELQTKACRQILALRQMLNEFPSEKPVDKPVD